MRLSKPAFLLYFIFLLGNAGFVMAQTLSVLEIINPKESDTLKYCSVPVAVAEYISISNSQINKESDGMKISITGNYQRGEDTLVWKEVMPFVGKYKWDNSHGYLEIKGIGTDEEYENAIANVFYTNIANVPTLGIRTFSISLLDADYLPATKHFYRYESKLDIKWTESRDLAASMIYHGLHGYLATITSKVENDFIWTKIDGIGWIGANDSLVEGRWQWETGPEKGTHFWQGNQNGNPVNGEYSNWNNGEPNNVVKQSGVDEDYAHINANPNTVPKSWNDLPNAGDGPNSQYYRAKGFIVEFGGMPGDPEVKLSASAFIEVSKIAFSDEREFSICKLDEQILNDIVADEAYAYSWVLGEFINDSKLASPLVYPIDTTVYTAYGELGSCRDTAEFTVNVKPLPESRLAPEYVYCKGSSLTLDPGVHSSYLWSTGDTLQTITVADEGKYWVKLTNDFGCELVDTIEVKWSVRPVLDYSLVDTLVCGSKTQTLNLSFVGVSAETKLTALDPRASVTDASSLTPTITVREYDRYLFKMEIQDEYGCEFLDTLKVEFHNQPEAKIVMDEDKCKGYSLDVSFGGKTVEDALFTWYYNDSVFRSAVNLFDTIIPLGYGELNRTVALKVNEKGCSDSTVQNVTVTPNVEIETENNEGCTPLTVRFNAKVTEAVKSYFWDFGNGENSANQQEQVEYINPELVDQSFGVSLTVVSQENCTNRGFMNNLVLVHPKPTIDLSFEEDDCNPEQMEIYYVGSGSDSATYHWDLHAFNPDEILQNPGNTKGPLEIKRYSAPLAEVGISMTSAFQCKSDSIGKTWKRKPVFEILVDTTEGCPPLDVSAKAIVLDEVDKVAFTYRLGDATTGSGGSFKHTFINANTQNEIEFTGTSSISGCNETILYNDSVFVYPVPEARFTPVPEAVIISDPEIVFENTSTGADNYEWDFGDMSAISTEHSPTHSYTGMGFYNVILAAYNNYNCFDSISSRVAVAFDKLFPPNAFSPNASAEEDREFRIHSEGVSDEAYQLLIYNRWGQIIFKSNSQQIGWDGKMKTDTFAPAGVYTWVLQYTDFRGEKHKQQGTVSLIF